MNAHLIVWNAKNCPRDGYPLAWEQFAGLRTFTVDDQGRKVFTAKCTHCYRRFESRRKAAP